MCLCESSHRVKVSVKTIGGPDIGLGEESGNKN